MVVRGAVALGICLLASGSAWAQALPTAATIESIPLELTMPENYLVTSVLEPVRRVALVAPADGTVRSLEVPLGAAVRANAGDRPARPDRGHGLGEDGAGGGQGEASPGEIGRGKRGGVQGPARGGRGQGRDRAARARSPDAAGSVRGTDRRASRELRPVRPQGNGDRGAGRRDGPEIAGPRRSQDGRRGQRSQGLRRGAGADRQGPVDLAAPRSLCSSA